MNDTEGDDRLAARLRGFGPLGLLAMVVIVAGALVFTPLGAALVLAWAWRSRTPWREIGFVRPSSWVATVVGGIVVGVAFKFAMKALIMPLFWHDPVNHAYHYLAHNPAALPEMLLAIVVGAGFGEEVFYRGYLFERLGKLLGPSPGARVAIVIVTTAIFGSVHYPGQGVPGVEQALVTGLVFGVVYAFTRSLFFLMFVHAAFDLTAVWMIYNDLEAKIGHWIFK